MEEKGFFQTRAGRLTIAFLYYHGGICPHAERATFKQRHLMSRRVSFDSRRFALLPDGRTSVCAFKKR